MALILVVRSGEATEPPQLTFEAPRVLLGRGESCDLRLPDPSVSHRHATIRQRGQEYLLVDEGSTNGTFIGQVRLAPQSPRVVRSGDLIRVGRIWLELRLDAAPSHASSPAQTRELALSLVAEALKGQGEATVARVEITGGADLGRQLALEENEKRYVIGRSAHADLPIYDVDASRRHVEVWRRGAQVLLRELGSKNGCSLGGVPLVTDREMPWSPGSELAIGTDRLALLDPVSDALRELETSGDEHLTPGQSVPPPSGTEPDKVAQQTSVDAPAEGAEEVVAPAELTAPPLRLTKRRRLDPDWTIGLFALFVLLASLLGLKLLVGGS